MVRKRYWPMENQFTHRICAKVILSMLWIPPPPFSIQKSFKTEFVTVL